MAETRCLLNDVRAAHELRPLGPDRQLARAARAHSRDMVRRQYFSHTSPSGDTLVDRVARTGWLRQRTRWHLGENLAWGVGDAGTPAAVVRAWMRSPAHRRIVLEPDFRRVGIDITMATPVRRPGGITVTADFGS